MLSEEEGTSVRAECNALYTLKSFLLLMRKVDDWGDLKSILQISIKSVNIPDG